MSDKLPALRPQQLIRALERAGWRHDRTRGSHHYLVHPDKHEALSVPVHNRDVKPGLLHAIIKSAGLSRDEFRKLL
ncbi:MAG: type II toxin-antitoxin system HicA family toxin [Solirubrobacteraceae bacterium]